MTTTVQVIEEQAQVIVQSPGPQGPVGPTGAQGPTGPIGPGDSIEFDGGTPSTVFAGLSFDGGGVS